MALKVATLKIFFEKDLFTLLHAPKIYFHGPIAIQGRKKGMDSRRNKENTRPDKETPFRRSDGGGGSLV